MTGGEPGRVVLTADTVGGVWTYAADLSRGLTERGVSVSLAVLGPRPTATMRAQLSPRVAVLEADLALDWLDGPASMRATALALEGLARAQGADLLHLNSPALAGEGVFSLPVVGGCHSCLGTWWQAMRGSEPLPADMLASVSASRRGYAACDALIAPTEAFARATDALYGMRPHVIWNGRTREVVEAPRRRRAVAFSAGRLWDPAKGTATLDAAAAEKPGLRIAAAGDVSAPNGDAAAFPHLNLLGRLAPPAVRERMAQSAVFVSMARYEPFGLSVLEAAQAGCALVLSDIDTFRELWSGAAVFVSPDDPVALSGCLTDLLNDPPRCASLGRAAAAQAARYGDDTMVEATLGLYRRVLGEGRASRVAA